MIGLLQRVSSASVAVKGVNVGAISTGLLVFIGIQREDTLISADCLLERILGYRVFRDDQGKMNCSLRDVNGGLLLVPEFTLAADTDKGRRPSFTSAASPSKGRELFDYFVNRAKRQHSIVACGCFGVDQCVTLINDGPVTFWLQAAQRSN